MAKFASKTHLHLAQLELRDRDLASIYGNLLRVPFLKDSAMIKGLQGCKNPGLTTSYCLALHSECLLHMDQLLWLQVKDMSHLTQCKANYTMACGLGSKEGRQRWIVCTIWIITCLKEAHLSNLLQLPSRLASLVAYFAQLGNGNMPCEVSVITTLNPCRTEHPD